MLMSDEVPLDDLAYAGVRITDAAGGPAVSGGGRDEDALAAWREAGPRDQRGRIRPVS
ncbi:hypothetical protein [Actinomadura welshii]|uniref:hypothetical protein n=1 Tax=Actinomadura welshii TaxID=3103817 RepID=UPI0003AD35AB|nr:hypothetical protein [Actinomadura madurae]